MISLIDFSWIQERWKHTRERKSKVPHPGLKLHCHISFCTGFAFSECVMQWHFSTVAFDYLNNPKCWLKWTHDKIKLSTYNISLSLTIITSSFSVGQFKESNMNFLRYVLVFFSFDLICIEIKLLNTINLQKLLWITIHLKLFFLILIGFKVNLFLIVFYQNISYITI